MLGIALSVGKIRAGGKACSDYQETGNVGSLELATFAVDKNACLSAVRQSPTNIKSFPRSLLDRIDSKYK